jgi:hypothetical protein
MCQDTENSGTEQYPLGVFELRNVRSQQLLALVEMRSDRKFLEPLFNDDFSIAVEDGGDYSLFPVDDPVIDKLADVHNSLKVLDQPNRQFGVLMDRYDRLIKTVEYLFSNQERVLIDSREELADYIKWQRRGKPGYAPRVIKRNFLSRQIAPFLPDPNAPAKSDSRSDEGIDPEEE